MNDNKTPYVTPDMNVITLSAKDDILGKSQTQHDGNDNYQDDIFNDWTDYKNTFTF